MVKMKTATKHPKAGVPGVLTPKISFYCPQKSLELRKHQLCADNDE